MHNNMITINGQKMASRWGTSSPSTSFSAVPPKMLEQAYSPMTIRFFILQAHYRSTVDFSNEALQAAEKGFQKLMKAIETIDKIKPSAGFFHFC
jgi:cysteinyl-tRNA synthetase